MDVKEIKILTFFANLCLRTTAGVQAPNTTSNHSTNTRFASASCSPVSDGAPPDPPGGEHPGLLPALPGKQVLAADTQGRLVVLGHTHLVRAALHLQAGVFGRVQG